MVEIEFLSSLVFVKLSGCLWWKIGDLGQNACRQGFLRRCYERFGR